LDTAVNGRDAYHFRFAGQSRRVERLHQLASPRIEKEWNSFMSVEPTGGTEKKALEGTPVGRACPEGSVEKNLD
jgi:hypothetical protein